MSRLSEELIEATYGPPSQAQIAERQRMSEARQAFVAHEAALTRNAEEGARMKKMWETPRRETAEEPKHRMSQGMGAYDDERPSDRIKRQVREREGNEQHEGMRYRR